MIDSRWYSQRLLRNSALKRDTVHSIAKIRLVQHIARPSQQQLSSCNLWSSQWQKYKKSRHTTVHSRLYCIKATVTRHMPVASKTTFYKNVDARYLSLAQSRRTFSGLPWIWNYSSIFISISTDYTDYILYRPIRPMHRISAKRRWFLL